MNNIILLAVIAVCIVILVLIVIFVLYRRQPSQSQTAPSTVTPATPTVPESPDLLELEKAHKEVMTALAVESRMATYDLAEASMELSIARRRAQVRQRRDQANNLQQGP